MPIENTPQPKKQGKSKPITLYPQTVEEASKRTLDAGPLPGKRVKKHTSDTRKPAEGCVNPIVALFYTTKGKQHNGINTLLYPT